MVEGGSTSMTGVGSLQGRVVVFGVTGGIAAYKAPEICRLLVKAGASVQVIMTPAAAQFVTPLTLQTVSGRKVGRELFDLTEESEIGHVRMADQADLLLVAPATADFIARMAAGMADDLLSTVALATRAPILIAPAMNVNMWENPMTQANLARLLGRPGPAPVATVGPDRGPLACGWVGAGRLIDPEVIVAEAARMLAPGDLHGVRVVVTAGPTFEAIDDVRFIGNRSSGKMGFALAAAAAARGAAVTLIAGPVGLPTPPRVASRIDVESAEQMGGALRAATAGADVVVMAAAVADFRPTVRSAGKLSRRLQPTDLAVSLTPNPDLLAEIGAARVGARPTLIGFAVETDTDDQVVAYARGKLTKKRVDLVVANHASDSFGRDDNRATLVDAERAEPLGVLSKPALADRILDRVLALCHR
ncbi:MAG TPA: bifunctional phosphopantothenoylcysteine decarboxylase/phosphopantothenate--cysteine ligase CoaBC [Polyangia bacterium]|nr:bifunctional phosphopantothenoylcysteine decarboxylase/phosphopantothenate--cysteine ligase CoaBC [Polyangia bacterium]